MGKVELLAVEGTAGNPLCSLWQGWHQGAGEIAVEFKEITCLKKKKKKIDPDPFTLPESVDSRCL